MSLYIYLYLYIYIFHGCKKCFNENDISPISKKMYKDLYNYTMKREKFIKSLGYKIITIWECDWNKTDKSDINYSNIEILNHYYMCKLKENIVDDKKSDGLDDIYNSYINWYNNNYNGYMVSKNKFCIHFINKGYKHNIYGRMIGLIFR